MMRKLFSTLLVLLLVCSLGANADAAKGKYLVVLQAGKESHEGMARAVHALLYSKELKEHGHDVVLLFDEARRLTEDMIKLFWDEKGGGFFFTATDAEKLLIGEREIYDGAIPSGNSIAALDLLRMGRLTLNRAMGEKSARIF